MTNDIEAEADAFAMELLMPESLVRDYLKALPEKSHIDLCDDTDQVLSKMAKKFAVSRAMLTIRLRDLGII